ncbi:MAG: DUF805 domain-containing protein [Candidatus Thermoplasmatota archaeon]|nr:DUF805 domain-containing protein [Candidatus Thermoplasmatota archaeon]
MVVLDTPQPTGRPTEQIGFVDAVKKALMHNYANFNGRASRSEYWWFFLFGFSISIPAMILDGLTGIVLIDAGAGASYGPFYLLGAMGLFLPGLSAMVRRLHDSGRSGWWYFIALVPCAGIIILLVFLIQDGQPHPNDYGEVPTNTLPVD